MAFNETLKLTVKRRAHFFCCLCRALGVEVHHIVPQEQGGADTIDNAAPLCPSCHETYGANPHKRKFIREARDLWYEICAKRYDSDPDRFAELSSLLEKAATKADLDAAVNKMTELVRAAATRPDVSQQSRKDEVSQLSGLAVTAGVGINRYCRNCKSLTGILIGDTGRCPDCGTPWSTA